MNPIDDYLTPESLHGLVLLLGWCTDLSTDDILADWHLWVRVGLFLPITEEQWVLDTLALNMQHSDAWCLVPWLLRLRLKQHVGLAT